MLCNHLKGERHKFVCVAFNIITNKQIEQSDSSSSILSYVRLGGEEDRKIESQKTTKERAGRFVTCWISWSYKRQTNGPFYFLKSKPEKDLRIVISIVYEFRIRWGGPTRKKHNSYSLLDSLLHIRNVHLLLSYVQWAISRSFSDIVCLRTQNSLFFSLFQLGIQILHQEQSVRYFR